MGSILQGVEGTICYIDDILVTAPTDQEHLDRLREVERTGLKLKQEKCIFFQQSVEYLGHLIDAYDLHPLPGKVEVIVKALQTSSNFDLS